MPRLDLRAKGDQDLADKLLDDRRIRKAVERFERDVKEVSARRQLLGTSMRLTAEMAPDVHAIIDACRQELGLDSPFETYVYPSAAFNAAAVRPERGLLFIMLSSSLLEAFEPDELRFVIGHELGHHLFEHHRIPVPALLGQPGGVTAAIALRLFAWQRYAEISCDRAGVVCAGGLEPAAHALFKLASGLRGDRVRVRIDQFLAQLRDLREEAEREISAKAPARSDWFATHPFSPVRLRAAELFAGSERMVAGGTPMAELEARVQDVMSVMNPSYLQERSDVAEAMRRLLFAAGVLIAAEAGEAEADELEALAELLGPGSVPREVNPEAIRAELPKRIEAVKRDVPPLRRAQVIRDLCVIARADGVVTAGERRILDEVAAAVEVDPELVSCSVEAEDRYDGLSKS